MPQPKPQNLFEERCAGCECAGIALTYRQCIRRAWELGERVGRVEAGHGGYTVVELNRFVPDAGTTG